MITALCYIAGVAVMFCVPAARRKKWPLLFGLLIGYGLTATLGERLENLAVDSSTVGQDIPLAELDQASADAWYGFVRRLVPVLASLSKAGKADRCIAAFVGGPSALDVDPVDSAGLMTAYSLLQESHENNERDFEAVDLDSVSSVLAKNLIEHHGFEWDDFMLLNKSPEDVTAAEKERYCFGLYSLFNTLLTQDKVTVASFMLDIARR